MRWQPMIVILAACGTGSSPSAPSTAAPQAVAPSGSAHVTPKRLWARELVSYERADFVENSAFSRDVAVVAKVPGVAIDMIGVIALDPATGKELWHLTERGWLLHPPAGTSPLYLAPLARTGDFQDGYAQLERIDPRTGDVLATVTLERDALHDVDTRLVWSQAAALVITSDSVTAFDWTTGKRRWTTNVGDGANRHAPAVIGDRMFVPGETVRVLSLADGKQLAAIPTGCCDVLTAPSIVASPDGKHVFVPGKLDETLEIDAQLHPHHLDGEIRAASNRYYAVERTADHPIVRRVEVATYDRSEPILTLAPRDTSDFYSAIALSDDHVFYFHDADATFAQQQLPAGEVERIDQISAHGAAPAHLGTPPAIVLPYLFTEEWGVRGYLVGDR